MSIDHAGREKAVIAALNLRRLRQAKTIFCRIGIDRA
jgi:hypothetical protein